MTAAVLPLMPFPAIAWWVAALSVDEVLLDTAEPFRKMSLRNRYRIVAANGPLLLTIPLSGGRDQRRPMETLRIDYVRDWAKQHWRTLFSAYGRAPFFEHYAPALRELLQTAPEKLVDFNLATIRWLGQALQWRQAVTLITDFRQEYPADIMDLRFLNLDEPSCVFPRYAQVFEARHGYVPHLSLLDLLMNEGPAAGSLLRQQAGVQHGWAGR